MRLATARVSHGVRACLVDGESVGVTDFADGLAAIRFAGSDPGVLTEHVIESVALTDVTLLAPIPRPGKIFGSGINFRGHKEENPAAQMPIEPGFFSKFPSSVVGPGGEIRLPSPQSQVDYEVELAIVIGAPGHDIRPEDAFKHVFGYTVVKWDPLESTCRHASLSIL